MTDIAEYLRMTDALVNANHAADDELAYRSLASCILQHGRAFRGQAEPAWRGQQRQCFTNAFNLADEDRTLTYCEGYAASIIPVLHAWCVDPDGRVVDPTWDYMEDDREYFGIPFNLAWVRQHVMGTGYWGVLGGAYPALRDLMVSGFPDEALATLPMGTM